MIVLESLMSSANLAVDTGPTSSLSPFPFSSKSVATMIFSLVDL